MTKLQVELVTAEGPVLSTQADFVRVPGLDGELGIMPRHLALLTPIKAGEIKVVNDGNEDYIFVSGGFLEILPDKVVILADAAERAEDIDEARATEARRRAQEALAADSGNAEAVAAMERAMLRIRVAEIRRRHHGQGGGTRS